MVIKKINCFYYSIKIYKNEIIVLLNIRSKIIVILLNSKNKIIAMNFNYDWTLYLKIWKTSIRVQKIDTFALKAFKIIIINF